MADIVFLTLSAGGNEAPTLAIAHELSARGHRVRVFGAEAQHAAFAAAGLRFRVYRTAIPNPSDRMTALQKLPAALRLVGGRGYAAELADDLKREPADVVVIDTLLAGSIRAALPLGIPVVALMHTLARAMLVNPLVNVVARLRGFSASSVWSAADAVLVACEPAIDPAASGGAPANFIWTGVAERPPASAATPAGPARVLVSLSTGDAPGQRAVLQRILDGIAPMPIDAIVTTGPAIDPGHLRPGANTAVHRELPHLDLLPSCSAVISHGGHSTAMRALFHGLPMVLIPLWIDQPIVAEAVARTGAGIALAKRAAPAKIRRALERVLQEPSYRDAATAVGERMRARNGPAAAADLILKASRRELRGRATAVSERAPTQAG